MKNTLNSKHLLRILQKTAEKLNTDLQSDVIREADNLLRNYTELEFGEFTRDLRELANSTGIVYVIKEIEWEDFDMLMKNVDAPAIVFLDEKDDILPAMIETPKKNKKIVTVLSEEGEYEIEFSSITESSLFKSHGKIKVLTGLEYESVTGNTRDISDEEEQKDLSPVKRLLKLLSAERKDILYVYIYAFIIGIISLILPLGIQAAIEIISGGVFFSSIYFLLSIIILGVLGTGILQVLQITIVEYLQRRVFTKAAFEFAFRVPRIKMESVLHLHFPELMNRFFDVLTIQKGLPKLLIDLTTGVVQILFGLLLLSFYHPFFVFFGIALILILFLIFYYTGPKGLKSSIIESKYKYKAVYWLEELARALYSFKMSGSTELPLQRTDYFVNNYLNNRRQHFRVLVSQYSWVLLFKVIITAGLLIIGTVLVINREITLGQFVASEVIIILILNSVEKIIMYMDVIYDMLTAVDKIAHVTDLPLEKTGGIDIQSNLENGLAVETKNLSYQYPNKNAPCLRDINIKIDAGERVCISGIGGSGKTTLINNISGAFSSYHGSITFNKYSMRDLDIINLRDKIGKNVSTEDIFEGTIIDNILVGKPGVDETLAIKMLDKVGLLEDVNSLEKGLQSEILSGGKGFSETFIQKLILARCLAKDPKLLILNDYFNSFPKSEKLRIIQEITNQDFKCTVIIVSNDPLIMASCDRVIYLKEGTVYASGTMEEIMKNKEITDIINHP